MAGEVGIGATTGALQMGAAGGVLGAGLVAAGLVAGPIGWAVLAGGAVLGAISGGFGGSKARKAKKYARKAAAIQQQREANAAEDQFLQMIRQGRTTAAASLAASTALGIETSSLSTSALSSVRSQEGYNIQYLGEDRRLYSLYSRYMQKAGKAAQAYQTIASLQGATSSLMSALGSAGLSYANRVGTPQGTTTTTEWQP